MLRLKEWSQRAMNTVLDELSARLLRLENNTDVVVGGYTLTLNEKDGKLTATKGDTIITWTKD